MELISPYMDNFIQAYSYFKASTGLALAAL